MRSLRGFLLLSFVGALGTSACAAIFGFDDLGTENFKKPEAGVDAPTNDAPVNPDANPEAGPDVDPRCEQVGVAPEPNVADAGNDGPDQVTIALSKLDLGIEDTALPAGFNLDRKCTTKFAEGSCTSTAGEGSFDTYAKDLTATGMDNAGFPLLKFVGNFGSAFRPSGINDRLKDGEFGLVVRMTGWNGEANDESVVVEVFPAIGLVGGGKPTFTASDKWRLDDRFRDLVDHSKMLSKKGYVSANVIVAQFDELTLSVSVPDDPKPLDITIREVFVTGNLVRDGASYKITDGVIGGRWPTKSFLEQIRLIYVLNANGVVNRHLCEPPTKINGDIGDVYPIAKGAVCSARDIRSARLDDNLGKACDAFSVGMKVETYAITQEIQGPDFAQLPDAGLAQRCIKDGSVPAGDDCSP